MAPAPPACGQLDSKHIQSESVNFCFSRVDNGMQGCGCALLSLVLQAPGDSRIALQLKGGWADMQHNTFVKAWIYLSIMAALVRNTPQRPTTYKVASPVLLLALIMVSCVATATPSPCGTSAGDKAAAALFAHGQQIQSWRSLLILAATGIMTIKAHEASTARAGQCDCQRCRKSKTCKDGLCRPSRACSCSHCKKEKENRRTREYSRRFHCKSDTSKECGCQHTMVSGDAESAELLQSHCRMCRAAAESTRQSSLHVLYSGIAALAITTRAFVVFGHYRVKP
jgi:hypothetical protein